MVIIGVSKIMVDVLLLIFWSLGSTQTEVYQHLWIIVGYSSSIWPYDVATSISINSNLYGAITRPYR